MTDLNELIEWLQDGVSSGFITSDEAFKWVYRRTGDKSAAPTSAAARSDDHQKIRLKKDGSPWGKRGPRKQTEIPAIDKQGAV